MLKLKEFLKGCCLILWLVLSSMPQCHGTHVLAVLPSVWKSHYLFGYHLLEQMVQQRNYSVTLVSPYKGGGREKSSTEMDDPRFKEIQIDGLLENWTEMGLSFDIEEMYSKSVLEHFTRLMYATTSNTDALLQSPKVRELLHSQQQFDLLVVDLFLSDALMGLSFFYQIPTVVISPSGSNTWLNQRFGNSQNAALDPSNFLAYSKHMTLWQRSVNTLMVMFEKLTYSFFHMISQQVVYTKHFEPLCQNSPWCNTLPDHKDLIQNLSLALINTHPVLQYPRAFLPNMLTIAGVHLKNDNDNELVLPTHLKEFIEEAVQGVVYISFGANVYDFPQEKIELFLDVFETLPNMRFIVKYDEDEPLEMTLNVSSKVMVQNWWPQQAILAHTNVKLFISSCGFMSVTEAINFVKPILAIPITPEQHVLARNLQEQGSAFILNYNDLSYDQLLFAINETLTNTKKYHDSLSVLKSQLTEDILGLKPMDKVINAIEMTLTTKGLKYLKTHSHHLNFWSSILMDVMLILLFGLLAILAIPFLLTSCILRKSYQNQSTTNLTMLKNQIRYQRQVNDFLSNCSNPKHRHANESGEDLSLKTVRRSSSNSDLQRKRLSSACSHSSSCFYCSSGSSSAPGTPLTRESPSFRKSLESNDTQ
ncbi:UDP-glucosyltransferase 2 [Musca domestica]|uniref:UDP-glucosyltransferase 2 n=1 Tax=Musca domestica TaxID=7370 RepID=A0A9J7CPA4_MUSDO|nr:UDP-glucosyltransferase 2 [Musca domestica]